MARFDVTLNILVDAKDGDTAFAAVRSNYCVVNDPNNRVTEGLVDMHVGDVVQVEDDADVSEYA